MNRKTFIQKSTMGIILGIPAVTMISCSGSDDNGNSTPDPDPDPDPIAKDCVENGTSTTVSSSQNHTHSLTVSKEDVSAGTTKTYNLSESADHIHQVTLDDSDFQALKDNPGESLSKISSTDSGHSHNITVACA